MEREIEWVGSVKEEEEGEGCGHGKEKREGKKGEEEKKKRKEREREREREEGKKKEKGRVEGLFREKQKNRGGWLQGVGGEKGKLLGETRRNPRVWRLGGLRPVWATLSISKHFLSQNSLAI